MKSTGTLARLVEGSMDSEAWRAAGCAIRRCGALSAVAPSAAVMEQNSLLDSCFMRSPVSHFLLDRCRISNTGILWGAAFGVNGRSPHAVDRKSTRLNS